MKCAGLRRPGPIGFIATSWTGISSITFPSARESWRSEQMEKVRHARDWKAKNNPALDIEVDGGINPVTARVSIENGANVLVAGTSIFHATDYAKAIRELRETSR